MNLRLLLGTLCATALFAAPAAGADAPPAEVTGTALVQRDLGLAARYWAIEQPALSAGCSPVQVFVAPMAPAIGNDGVALPASTVWAETALSSCVIDISRSMWRAMQAPDRADRHAVCDMFAHEYGHTLGLADTASISMLNMDSGHQDDPLCAQTIDGWQGTSLRDRAWLVANALADWQLSWRQLAG